MRSMYSSFILLKMVRVTQWAILLCCQLGLCIFYFQVLSLQHIHKYHQTFVSCANAQIMDNLAKP